MFIRLKTRLLSPGHPARCRRLIVLALCALLPLGVSAAGPHSGTAAERAIGKEEDKEAALDTVYRKPSAVRLERDSTNPIFARKYKGTILDITSRVVVIDSWRGKSFIPRAEVAEIKRAGDAKAITLFEKYRKRARSLEDWVKLEAFAGKQELIPERRRTSRLKRRILER